MQALWLIEGRPRAGGRPKRIRPKTNPAGPNQTRRLGARTGAEARRSNDQVLNLAKSSGKSASDSGREDSSLGNETNKLKNPKPKAWLDGGAANARRKSVVRE